MARANNYKSSANSGKLRNFPIPPPAKLEIVQFIPLDSVKGFKVGDTVNWLGTPVPWTGKNCKIIGFTDLTHARIEWIYHSVPLDELEKVEDLKVKNDTKNTT